MYWIFFLIASLFVGTVGIGSPHETVIDRVRNETTPSQIFQASNIFLDTNEEKILNHCSLENKADKGNVIVAVGGLFSLELFIKRDQGDKDLILINIDPGYYYKEFWEAVAAAFLENKTKETTFDAIEKFFIGNLDKCYTNVRLAHFKNRTKEWVPSFFDQYKKISDNDFSKLQQLFLEKRFLHLPIDLTDSHAVASLKRSLESNKLSIDLLYVSNVSNWVVDSDNENHDAENQYIVNVERLVECDDDNSKPLLLHAYFKEINHKKKKWGLFQELIDFGSNKCITFDNQELIEKQLEKDKLIFPEHQPTIYIPDPS